MVMYIYLLIMGYKFNGKRHLYNFRPYEHGMSQLDYRYSEITKIKRWNLLVLMILVMGYGNMILIQFKILTEADAFQTWTKKRYVIR